MSAERSLWRRIFDSAERAAGAPLESVMNGAGFNEALVLALRLRTGLGRLAARTSSRFLHLWNLPSYGDVRRLSKQLGEMERQLRALSKRVDDRREGKPR